jgi:hypothetical protein
MKESKFIELLNLYVDHEITPAEAGELEAEIQRDPSRREVYLQYCRIQKGCTLLADKFRTEAPEPAVAMAAPRRSTPKWAYAGGLLAAAAAVAFVLTTQSRTPATSPDVNTPAPQLAVAATPTNARPVQQPTLRMDFQPVLVSHTLHLNGLSADAEPAAVAVNDEPRLDWLQNVHLTPLRSIPAEDLRFDTRASSPADNRVYAGRKPIGTAEMTAFQFQR